jgi:predicted transcriptional regulator
MSKDVTTVRISTELRDKLKKLGTKGETYEDVIQRLLEIAEKNKRDRS